MMLKLTQDWTPTQDEFDRFAKVSGDDNPIHVDPEFSARTRFGRTVSHGMLIYSKLWAMIMAARPDAVQTSQSMMFPNPSFTGETLRLSVVEVAENEFEIKATRIADGAETFVGKADIA